MGWGGWGDEMLTRYVDENIAESLTDEYLFDSPDVKPNKLVK